MTDTLTLIEYRTTPEGEFTIQHVIKPHKAKRIRQLSELRPNYKGKNPAGGRKCFFRHSATYRNGPSVASQWSGYGRWINETTFTKGD